MFKCEQCGQTVPPRTPAVKVVVETRVKQYPARQKFYPPLVKQPGELFPRPNPQARRELWHDDPGGVGTEIMREMQLCPACAELLKQP